GLRNSTQRASGWPQEDHWDRGGRVRRSRWQKTRRRGVFLELEDSKQGKTRGEQGWLTSWSYPDGEHELELAHRSVFEAREFREWRTVFLELPLHTLQGERRRKSRICLGS